MRYEMISRAFSTKSRDVKSLQRNTFGCWAGAGPNPGCGVGMAGAAGAGGEDGGAVGASAAAVGGLGGGFLAFGGGGILLLAGAAGTGESSAITGSGSITVAEAPALMPASAESHDEALCAIATRTGTLCGS